VPRRARLAIAGIPWHIIQRGNNRCACFYHEEDYRFYLEQLGAQARKFGCLVHAYCLMTNHVHLLVTPHEKDSASLLMKHLGQRAMCNSLTGRTSAPVRCGRVDSSHA